MSFSESKYIDECLNEETILKNLGIKFIHMPCYMDKVPSKEVMGKFLEIMKKARSKNNKVFIHCNEGKDRAGFFAATYKMKYKLASKNDCIREMIELGHDNYKYPKLTEYLRGY